MTRLWKSIWRAKTPPKLKVFLCECGLQALPTNHLLHGRGMNVLFCSNAQEDIQHLFWECQITNQFWVSILSSYFFFDEKESAPRVHPSIVSHLREKDSSSTQTVHRWETREKLAQGPSSEAITGIR
ncbi:hypothetical protein PVK06_033898 [Gossypium arboreum]|uniref:Reverse transcriptase zinc-binding domain-containing protein n=1 Tax=Gossypium arboreum TaxID=29729 RepID=A0ABR0NCN9_GOSAR|nr:hypothetical protein PVK06_033898 [Gossypium arboreum]